MLELRNIDLSFNAGTPDEVKLFHDFDLTVDTGSFVSIIGSNGSGKTSLLNLVSGTLMPDSGNILLNDERIEKLPEFKRSQRLGRVYQDPSLGSCPTLTVEENLSLAEHKGQAYGLGRSVRPENRTMYRDMLAEFGLGLEHRLGQKVSTLSGGQRQALALLMATLQPLDLLILDEHTAALDPKSSEIVMHKTGELVERNKRTTLMVTHNLNFALEYGDRLLMFHEGHIVMDRAGEEKKRTTLDEILTQFNAISIEAGNSI